MNGICDKLIDRHPHIYGDGGQRRGNGEGQLEQLKLKEGKKRFGRRTKRAAELGQSLPAFRTRFGALVLIGSTLVKSGDKVEELCGISGRGGRRPDRAADEFGDVLFALVNYARFKDINPDEALERTNRRFQARFQHMESAIQSGVEQGGKTMAEMSLTELDTYWSRAKTALSSTSLE